MGVRDSHELLSRSRAREVAGAGGTALYLSSDRPDTMFASKTAMRHVSKPNVLMNARLQRLGRYQEGKLVLVWCYPLQELPNGIRVDGDGDLAPTTELLRRSTSGGRCSQVWFAHVGLLLSHTGHDRTEFCRVGVLCDWKCDGKRFSVQGLLV